MPKLSRLPAHVCRRLQTVDYEFHNLEKEVNEIQASPSVGQFAGKPDEPRYTPLEKAVKYNDIPLTRALLDLGADPLIGGNHSPIVACVLNGNPGLLALFLDHPRCRGMDINHIFYGSDPLVVVALKEFMKITENQQLINTVTNKRLSEIWQVFQLLFTYPKTKARKHHQSLLHLCSMALFKMHIHMYEWVMMNYIDTISELVSTGANCNQKNADGETPILTFFYYAILPINKLPDQIKSHMIVILFQGLLKLIPSSLYPIDLTVFKTYGDVEAPQLRYKTPLMLLIQQPENARPGNVKMLVLREIEKQAFEKIFVLRKQGKKSDEIQNSLHKFLMAHVCIPPDPTQSSPEDKYIWEEAVKAIREIEQRCLQLLSVVAVANPKTIKDCRFDPKMNEQLVQEGFNLDGICQQQLPPNNRTLLDWAVVRDGDRGIMVPSIINIFEGGSDRDIKSAVHALFAALHNKRPMNMLRSLLIYAFGICYKPSDFVNTYKLFLFYAANFNRYDLTFFLINLFYFLPEVTKAYDPLVKSLIWDTLRRTSWKQGTIMSIALQQSQDLGDLLLHLLSSEMMHRLFEIRTELFKPSKSSKQPSTPSDGTVAVANPVVDFDDTLKGILNLGKQIIQREAQGCLPNDASPESIERVQRTVVKPLFFTYLDRVVKLQAFHERNPKSSAAHSVRRQLNLVDYIFSFVVPEGVSEESEPAQLARQKFNMFCFEAFKRHNAGRFLEKKPAAAPTKTNAGQALANTAQVTASAMQTEAEGVKPSKKRCILLQKSSDV